jgi:hypothetical protein
MEKFPFPYIYFAVANPIHMGNRVEVRITDIPTEYHDDIASISRYYGVPLKKLIGSELLRVILDYVKSQPEHIRQFDRPQKKRPL